MKLPLTIAVRIALNSQLLDGGTKLPQDKEGVAQVIERLGYVQIDTIAVIERAHHHTLWTRLPDYQPQMLHELQASDRRVFEYWGHAASYLPMSDYRYYMTRMRAFPWGEGWIKNMYEGHKTVMKEVLARIRKEGPLGSADFKAPEDGKRGTWWDWKPAKTALELLLWRGDLMVTARRNFQRIYDLTERVLPQGTDTRIPDSDELARFRIHKALSSSGIATEREIIDHLHLPEGKRIPTALVEMLNAGNVTKVAIDGIEGADYYTLSGTINNVTRLRKGKSRLHLLSPFDNLVIDRRRIEQLFKFSYALECYTPPNKRTYGYFSLPMLWKESLVGRIDIKAERKSGTLIIRNLVWEEKFKDHEDILPPLAEHLHKFAAFNRCNDVSVEQTLPDRLRKPLQKALTP